MQFSRGAVLTEIGGNLISSFKLLGYSPAQEFALEKASAKLFGCLLYTSDAADERSSVDLGGRRIIKKNKNTTHKQTQTNITLIEHNFILFPS